MFELLRGPLALLSFTVFLAGTAYQIHAFFRLTERIDRPFSRKKPPRPLLQKLLSALRLADRSRRVKNVLGLEPGMVVITSLFHLLLVLVPLTLYPHALLLERSWGIPFPSLPIRVSSVLTHVVLLFAVFFFFRRLFVDKVRSITSPGDAFIYLIVFLPFVTGLLAHHRAFDYEGLLLVHFASGELMLIVIPFTRLKHMVFSILNRLLIRSEYGSPWARRAWKLSNDGTGHGLY